MGMNLQPESKVLSMCCKWQDQCPFLFLGDRERYSGPFPTCAQRNSFNILLSSNTKFESMTDCSMLNVCFRKSAPTMPLAATYWLAHMDKYLELRDAEQPPIELGVVKKKINELIDIFYRALDAEKLGEEVCNSSISFTLIDYAYSCFEFLKSWCIAREIPS